MNILVFAVHSFESQRIEDVFLLTRNFRIVWCAIVHIAKDLHSLVVATLGVKVSG